MSELGQKFKAAREKRGISIQEVGLSLKINPRVIAAIENGERETLPARTFLRGFVKSYGQFLRLENKDIMDSFQREYGGDPAAVGTPVTTDAAAGEPAGSTEPSTAPTTVTPVSAPANTGPRSLADSPGIAKENIAEESRFPIGKVLLGILLFGAVIFLAKLVDKYQRERVLPETAVISESPTPEPGSENAEVTDAATFTSGTLGDISAEIPPIGMTTPTPAASPSPGASPSPAATMAPSPTASPTPKATPSPTPKATPTPTPTPTPKPSPSPSPTPNAAPTSSPSTPAAAGEALVRPLEVIVETNKTVRIRYDLGDGKSTTLDLTAGQLHTFRSKFPITLDVSDGGALSIIVNGRDRGKPGTSGQPVQLRLRE